ncbi:hypothetical protein BK653_20520 [Pseudomonas brassicacearum]|nr:hypothetical protein BK653_20520 [Pseudomonas brassicacearum]
MLITTEGAIHQPMSILHIKGQTANKVLLFFARADEIETILVLGVKHDGFRTGLKGDRVA